MTTSEDMVLEQKEFCLANKYMFVETNEQDIVGLAVDTYGIPINGLRHPPENDTSGWYIWLGEDFSADDEFFSPLHAKHLRQRVPEVVKYLGLPPGHRFLVAGEHVDIWFDSSLLKN